MTDRLVVVRRTTVDVVLVSGRPEVEFQTDSDGGQDSGGGQDLAEGTGLEAGLSRLRRMKSCAFVKGTLSSKFRAFFAESEIFVPNSDSDPVPDAVI
jgi:hypothetical protein